LTAADPASRVYIKNLEERIKPDELKEALSEIFSEYGSIIDLVAKTNLKAKGQAFIVFDNADAAARAIEEVQGFELFDKPMQLDFAKTRSDATVLKDGGEQELDAHKRKRMAEKGTGLSCRIVPRVCSLTPSQSVNKQPKLPRNRHSSALLPPPRFLPSLLAQSKPPVELASSRPIQLLQRSYRTSTFRQTKFSFYETFQRATRRKDYPRYSLDSKDSEKCEWCRDEKVLLSWNMKPRPERSVPRKLRLA